GVGSSATGVAFSIGWSAVLTRVRLTYTPLPPPSIVSVPAILGGLGSGTRRRPGSRQARPPVVRCTVVPEWRPPATLRVLPSSPAEAPQGVGDEAVQRTGAIDRPPKSSHMRHSTSAPDARPSSRRASEAPAPS